MQQNTETQETGCGQEAFYEDNVLYTKELLKEYRRAENPGERAVPLSVALELAIAIIFLLLKRWFSVIVFAAIAVMQFLIKTVIRKQSMEAEFRKKKNLWQTEKTIRLYEDFAEVITDGQAKHLDYDDFYRMAESEDHIFMIAGAAEIIAVRKENCPEEVIRAIKELFEL